MSTYNYYYQRSKLEHKVRYTQKNLNYESLRIYFNQKTEHLKKSIEKSEELQNFKPSLNFHPTEKA